ncbi:MAG: PQQ-dependent sugar dehydrogenase [Chitinophagaceae bacterium]|nr:PQQ-dependent sugar dehydrogenase [Chitinophagaceae bacterium]
MIPKLLFTILFSCTLVIFLSRCTSRASGKKEISAESASIERGLLLFDKNCSGCHNFRQDGIGPSLAGITAALPVEKLLSFIKNAPQAIAAGGERARNLTTKFKNAVMPPFTQLKENELQDIIAYLHTKKSIPTLQNKFSQNAITNPIPEPIELSSLVVNLSALIQMPATDSVSPLAKITKLDYLPGKGDLFVNDTRGKLYKLKNEQVITFLNIAEYRPQFINEPGLATGFGSFAFHPAYQQNGLLYTTHTESAGSAKADFSFNDSIKVAMQWVLTEWKSNDPNADTFKGQSRELLRIDMVTGIHGVQEIVFNPMAKKGHADYGLLYIGVGDGGSTERGYGHLVQSIEQAWGTVLCINPLGKNSRNGKYGIPETNPFVKNAGSKTATEVYAYGFRNPHRITWSATGDMLVSNIGQGNIEALDLVKPGNNCGWPLREGTFVSADLEENMGSVYPLPANDSIYKITYPVVQYDHDEGHAIAGGFEYIGSLIPELKGKFLFGDIPDGRLFYVDMADIKQGSQATVKEWKIKINGLPATLKEACGSQRVDLHFGRDMQGELYILTKADGKMYKLTNKQN